MSRRLIAAICLIGLSAGCARVSESRLNPFNWFGGSREVQSIEPAEGYDPVAADPRPLMDQVTQFAVERRPGGAVLRATGLPPTQGYWDGELLALNDGEPVDGVLEYRFVAAPPATPSRVSTQRSREVVVGAWLSDQDLAGVREIRVTAARNARAARR